MSDCLHRPTTGAATPPPAPPKKPSQSQAERSVRDIPGIAPFLPVLERHGLEEIDRFEFGKLVGLPSGGRFRLAIRVSPALYRRSGLAFCLRSSETFAVGDQFISVGSIWDSDEELSGRRLTPDVLDAVLSRMAYCGARS